MAKPLAFFCEVPRYEELCDMFDGKVIDFAEGGPIGQAVLSGAGGSRLWKATLWNPDTMACGSQWRSTRRRPTA